MNRMLLAILPIGLGVLTGCNQTDPYLRPGVWQPTGANAQNLAAMIQTPSDLIRGRGTVGSPGVEAAPPVARFWAGRPVALPDTNSQSSGSGQGRSEATSAGTGGTTAAQN